jgi:hypothetical protein
MQYFIFIFFQNNNYEIGVSSTNKEGWKGGKGKGVNGTHEENRRN